jgi:hypothetical protein
MTAKYYIYRNLHKGGFSVKHRGRVVARPKTFVLENPELNVSEAGQRRARATRQRNVHAYIVGSKFVERDRRPTGLKGKLYYNPFTCETFVDYDTQRPIKELNQVVFSGDVAYYK